MSTARVLRRCLPLLLLVLGPAVAGFQAAPAQDRSVPRFGPLVAPDTVQTGTYDLGRVWSFARPPLDYLRETYDVPADERGLEHLRRSTLRLPDCSGALVSAQGLLLTAARCVRPRLTGAEADSLRSQAFLARTTGEEPSLSALYAEQLVDLTDVTGRVEAELSGGASGPDARRAAAATVRRTLAEGLPPDQRVEVVSEGGGDRYVAYTYRRYDDVRLVFLPHRAVTLAGLSDQLQSYPQHAWDVAALRVYRDGEPLETPDHLEPRSQGVRPGDPVFAVGHPPADRRVETAEQLAFRRDVILPARVAALRDWGAHLRTYVDTAASAPEGSDRLWTHRAATKEVRARLDALRSSYFQNRLRARDDELRRATGDETGALLDRLAALQDEKRALAEQYRAFSFLLRPAHSSSTLRRALTAHRARQAGRLPPEDSLRAIPRQPTALDAARMDDHRRELRTHLDDDSLLVRTLRSAPSSRQLVRQSVFSAPESAVDALGPDAYPADDPALRIVSALYEQYEAFADTWVRLREREQRLTDSLAALRHRRLDVPPALPEARAPRFADGRVRGYSYNGTLAGPFTTFYGLYAHHHSARTETAPALPAVWESPPSALARSTQLATVSATDLRGAYGGPLVDASLQLVGLQTDGNVQNAAGTYLYLPQRMRTVSVDVRGLLEGLSSVYGADALIEEITGSPPSTGSPSSE